MALTAEDVTAISAALDSTGKDAVAALRQRFPSLSFTQCDASDMLEEPYIVGKAAEIHLLDTSDHCVSITRNPATASGLILAWVKR